jgi:hypothetical protein
MKDYKTMAINRDDIGMERIRELAYDRCTTVSAMMRALIKDAHDKLQQKERIAR